MTVEKRLKADGLTVKWDEYCLGARVRDTIYLNPNLLNYPDKLEKVIQHELKHSGEMTVKDFHMDLVDGSMFDFFFFSLEHPRSLRRLIPFYYDKELQVDFNLIIIYSIVVLLFSAILYVS